MHMSDERKGRLEKRFGHHSMTAPLFRVMIHKELVHLLSQVYAGEIERAHLKGDKEEDGLALGGLDIQPIDAVRLPVCLLV
jgi:calcium permeable stress-gated cation channel